MQSTATALQSTPEGYDGRVDYITAYWSPDDANRFPETSILEAINGKITEGYTERSARHAGITWLQAAGIGLGIRADERFYRAQGDCAASYWALHSKGCTQVSRLDVALTVALSEPEHGAAQRLYREFCALPRAAGQPRTAKLVQDSKRGETCSVGSRTSDVYLRVYDWGVAHASAPSGCRWRFEAELKGERATSALALLRDDASPELAAAALARTLFTDRRIEVPVMTQTKRISIRVREETDIEAKLRWLEQSIGPSVRKMIDAGYIEAVLDALGITEHVSINSPK